MARPARGHETVRQQVDGTPEPEDRAHVLPPEEQEDVKDDEVATNCEPEEPDPHERPERENEKERSSTNMQTWNSAEMGLTSST